MAKTKNKRNSRIADKVQNKKKSVTNKLNPFEVHINREKLKVLGKKSKHDRGLPGVSRTKAVQKRKETLGLEMKLMNKTNAFIDRRIGEKNNALSAEEKSLARYAAERVKQQSKKNIYNLADDEILTHRGQTLEQIEKFDDPRSSDEEDEDGRKFGGLDDEFVAEGHFGGGLLSRTDTKDGAKSHKDLIEQLIAESKKRKAEKQKEKEQTLDLTEKLDSDWKDLQPVVFKKPRLEEKKTEEPSIIDKLLSKVEKKAEDYDKTMRELKFEKRGTPLDGLKNEEKLAKEEKLRIEKLEKEREQRMFDTESSIQRSQIKTTHRSAEDLDDNFELDDEPNFMLAYDKDGNPLVPEHILRDNSVGEKEKSFDDGISDSSTDESSEDEPSIHDNTESNVDENVIDSHISDKAKSLEKEPSKDDANSDNGSEDGSDSESSEDGSDEDKPDEITENSKEQVFLNLGDLKHSDDESEEELLNGEEQKKIHSFFDLKSTESDNLKELLSDKTPTQQSSILQKLIKSHDPSLGESNKENLTRLFAHLLQHLHDIFFNLKTEEQVKHAFDIFNKLAPYFYDLSHSNVVITKKYLVDVLTEKHNEYRKKPKAVPDLDTLIFFKLVSLLYPTSDYKHPVVTPCFAFMAEILRKSQFNDTFSISRGIFLTALLLEYTVFSKRYVPSMINFFRGILYLCSNTSILNPIQVVPPFRLHRDFKFLNLDQDCSDMEVKEKMSARDLVINVVNDEFKIRCLLMTLTMLKDTFDNLNDLEAQQCIFEPHINLLSRVDLELYPKKIAAQANEVLQYMKQVLEVKTFTPIMREKKRPKALKLYEPDIQEVFTGNKSSKLSRDMVDKKKILHKYKREMKGAIREIRRDKSYIASVKIKQKIQSDNIRKDKVKQIYKEASIQQGELNKIKRMK